MEGGYEGCVLQPLGGGRTWNRDKAAVYPLDQTFDDDLLILGSISTRQILLPGSSTHEFVAGKSALGGFAGRNTQRKRRRMVIRGRRWRRRRRSATTTLDAHRNNPKKERKKKYEALKKIFRIVGVHRSLKVQ